MKKTIIYSIALMLFASCINEYKIPDTVSESYKEELVIQGRILSGDNSAIYISRTSPFGSKEQLEQFIPNAEVRIISQKGYESEPAIYNEQQRQYTLNTAELPQGDHYAVKVILDGETYQSEFQPLQDSPEIDSITYKESEDGISIHVTTFNTEDGGRGYMWTYEEDWEFHADIDFADPTGKFLYNKDKYPVEVNKNPYYYCWGNQKSSNIMIYSTENLKENTVKEHELLRIPIEDIRISYVYSILVKQWVLSNDAYRYFRTMKSYTEEAGSLFAPLPSEIVGNMKCTSNPNIKVKGYVIAANVVEKRVFIHESDFKSIHSEYENCSWQSNANWLNWEKAWQDMLNNGTVVIYTSSGKLDNNSILYRKPCFDCMQTKGATKKRPDFWPNNHE